MAKRQTQTRSRRSKADGGRPIKNADDVLRRLDRLEQQMHRLSELIREHAEDADRLVRIVAEDRNLIRRELLRRHQAQVRARDFLRRVPAKLGIDH
jgi:hypothetical protein